MGSISLSLSELILGREFRLCVVVGIPIMQPEIKGIALMGVPRRPVFSGTISV